MQPRRQGASRRVVRDSTSLRGCPQRRRRFFRRLVCESLEDRRLLAVEGLFSGAQTLDREVFFDFVVQPAETTAVASSGVSDTGVLGAGGGDFSPASAASDQGIALLPGPAAGAGSVGVVLDSTGVPFDGFLRLAPEAVTVPAPAVPADEMPEASLVVDAIPAADTPTPGLGWQTIVEETFEGAFPAENWRIYGSPSWDDVNYSAHRGSWSAYCVDTGVSPPGPYPNNANAWMVYGPFSLADADDAQVDFWYRNKSETDYDYFRWMASIDGQQFSGWQISGNQNSWRSQTFDLTNVPGLGNLAGRNQVWIAFSFVSDGSTTDVGAFVDDVVISKSVPATADLASQDLYVADPDALDRPLTTVMEGQEVALVHRFTYSGPNPSVTHTNRLQLDSGSAGDWTGTLSGAGTWYLYQPWSATAGTHRLRGWLDVANTMTEANETNNTRDENPCFSVTATADLAAVDLYPALPSDLTTPLATVIEGQAVALVYRFTYTGSTPSVTHTDRLQLDDAAPGEWMGSLDSVGTWYLYQTWTATAGSHRLRGWLDVTGAMNESNETNNTRDEDPAFRVSTLANLASLDVYPADPDDLATPLTTITAGQDVMLVHKFTYTGPTPSVPHTERLQLDGESPRDWTGTLASAGTFVYYSAWTATAGSHRLRGWLDVNNGMAESNEGDNFRDENPAFTVSTTERGQIQGTKWRDVDGDGGRDADETGLSGWKIYLDSNRNGLWDATEPFQMTSAAGNYTFADLPPGTYTVAEVSQDGWRQTHPSTAAASSPTDSRFSWTGWAVENLSAPDQQTATLDYLFSGTPEIDLIDGAARISLEGEETWAADYEPIIPVRGSAIVLPQGTSVVSVDVDPGPGTVIGTGLELLVADPSPTLAGDGSGSPTTAGASITTADMVRFSNQTLNGYSLGILRVFPLRYDLATGTVTYHSQVSVRVTVQDGQAAALPLFRGDALDAESVADFVDNPTTVASYRKTTDQAPSQLPPGGPFTYVIVTPNALAAAFQPLVGQKVHRGVTATVVTTEYINSNYTGTENHDLADKVRQFTADAYSHWNTRWLLLGGDADVVPTRVVTSNGSTDDGLATDLYFVCLDGTWNGDGDGVWGEANDGAGNGDVDLAAEVYVGRAPVSNVSEASYFVSKTVEYETTAHPNATRAVWLGEQLDNRPTWGSYSKFPIREDALPDDWAVTERYDSVLEDWTRSQFLADLNASPHIVNHLGHANETYNARLSLSDVDGLTNAFPYFMYSQGCYSGAFDLTDTIAERHVVSRNGAFAVIMNTRYGWYVPGNTPGASHHWDYEFWDAMFNEQLGHLGQANHDSKADNLFRVGTSGTSRWIHLELTLFGDPETSLQTATDLPGTHTVTLAAGQVVTGKDFGNWPLQAGEIRGTKWNDLDGDGVKEAGEPGLAGWQIYVDLDQDGQRDEAEPAQLTDANGDYVLSGLAAGSYQLAEVPQSGWQRTFPAAPGYHTVTLAAGQVVPGMNFGGWQPGEIRGAKWNDLDGDGLHDAGEPGLANWKIYLDTNRSGQWDAAEPFQLTDADGNYAFTRLAAGSYTLGEVPTPGWQQTFPATGTGGAASVERFAWTGWLADDPGVPSAQSTWLEYTFPDIPTLEVAGSGTALSLSGEQLWVSEGDPIVPVRNSPILLPQGSRIVSVEVDPGPGIVLATEVDLVVGEPLTGDDLPDAAGGATATSSLTTADMVAFSHQTLYGYDLGMLRVFPIRYDQPTGTVIFHPQVSVRVTTEGADGGSVSPLLRDDPEDAAAVMGLVDNPNGVAGYEAGAGTPSTLLPADGPFQYVVVTTEALAPAFEPLVAQKVRRGVTADIVTTEYIASQYAGTETHDLADKIREFVADAYATWNIRWLLLGGDSGVVPARGVYASYYTTVDNNLPTDLYYVCLDGSWNGDGDNLWGESNDGPGGHDVDLAAELYVGRAPVGDLTEAANFVNKTIQYETQVHPHAAQALWLGEKLDNRPTWGSYSKIPIRDDILPDDWALTERYDTASSTWTKSQLIADLNASPHIVNHLGHANQTSNARLNISDVNGLTNSFPYFMYSQGCYSGAFDLTESIAERHVVNSTGAFAVIMNTRYGWYQPGNVPGASHHWDYEFWDAVFNEDLMHLGQANHDSKLDNLFRVESTGTDRWINFEVMLFGDPETPFQVAAGVPGTHTVVLQPGQVVTGKDFGNRSAQAGQIRGITWNDKDGDAVRDGGEAGVASRRIYVDENQNGQWDAGEPAQLSDADGAYAFTGLLAGSYRVVMAETDGWQQTFPPAPGYHTVTLSVGQVVENLNFGQWQLGQIRGSAWQDQDGDGVRDSGEPGLSNWRIYLDGNLNGQWDTGESSQVTDASGNYAFVGLHAGTYRVAEVVQSTWQRTYPPAPGYHTVTLAAGQTVPAIDFGNRASAGIQGTVWQDSDADGVKDSGEAGLANWRVYVDGNQNGQWDTGEPSQTTTASGDYTFAGLPPGVYRVAEVVQTGWRQTAPASPGYHSVTLVAGQVVTGVDFGNWQPSQLRGLVWNDRDADRVKDSGEPGSAGWRVYLDRNQNGQWDADDPSQLTDTNGQYSFTELVAGTYRVAEVPQTGWLQSHPASPGFHTVTFAIGQIVDNIDFGNWQPAEIRGTKWNDLDGDGARDAGEPGLAGWQIYLDGNQNGQWDTGESVQVTDSGGNYAFAQLVPGSYRVAEVPQAGWQQRFPAVPGHHTLTVSAGQVLSNINFGNWQPAQIGGTVWNDLDGDGVPQAAEPGLSNWRVYIDQNQNGQWEAGEPVQTTDATGDYAFTGLGVGTYRIAHVVQAGWRQTFPSAPGYHGVTVAPGEAVSNIRFGNRAESGVPRVHPAGRLQQGGGDLDVYGIAPAVFVGDWNVDGRKDVIAGNYSPNAYVFVYLNVGTDAAPQLTSPFRVQDAAGDISGVVNAEPALTDWNHDGLQDLLMGQLYGLFVYLNEGTAAEPRFSNGTPVKTRDGSDLGGPLCVKDWNNDGLPDLLWNVEGSMDHAYVFLSLNDGTLDSPSFPQGQKLSAGGQTIHETYANAPVVADWDRDGKKDLLLRRSDGFVWCRNIGTDGAPVLDSPQAILLDSGEPLTLYGGDGVGNFSAVDWNNDGVLDVVAGDYDGHIEVFLGTLPDSQGAIRGSVWNDVDGDTVKDGGEAGLADWRVYLDANQNGQWESTEPSQLTDSSGNYAFTSVAAGTYRVAEVLPSGWQQTAPAAPGYHTVTVTPGQIVTGKDFGNQQTAATPEFYVTTNAGLEVVYSDGTHAVVTSDVDREAGVEVRGDRVHVYQSSTREIVGRDASGNAVSWTPVPTGLSFLRFTALEDGRFALLSQANDEVYFLNPSGSLLQTAKLKAEPDGKWQDVDAVQVGNRLIVAEDGDYHVLAIDLDTYTVSLMKDLSAWSGWLRTIDYAFGKYYVCLSDRVLSFTEGGEVTSVGTLPVYHIRSISVEGAFAYVTVNFADAIYRMDLSTGQAAVFASNLDYPVDLESASRTVGGEIRGSVWHDQDGDGLWDSGEAGLGWPLYLDVNANGVPDAGEAITIAGATGKYAFTGLASGTYRVAEFAADAWRQTAPPGGTYTVTLSDTEVVAGKDFGNQRLVDTAKWFVSTRDGLESVRWDGTHQVLVSGTSSTPGVEVRDDRLYAYLSGDRVIAAFDLDGHEQSRTPVPTGLYFIGFTALEDGRFALLNNWGDEVYFLDVNGTVLHTAKLKPEGDDHLQNVYGIQVGNRLIVSEDGDHHVLAIDLDTYDVSLFKDLSSWPGRLGAIDYAFGKYYVCQSTQILSFTESGAATVVATLPAGNLTGITVEGETAYVTVNHSGMMYSVDLTTGQAALFASGFNYPEDLASAHRTVGGEIRGSVWDDQDGDGAWDGGEPGLSGWRVYVDANGNQAWDAAEVSTLTGPTGTYALTGLAAGTYQVGEVVPSEWQRTAPAAGWYSLTLGEDQLLVGKDFGNRRTNRPPTAIADAYSVYEDGILTVPAPGVLANDVEPDGQPLSVVLVDGPLHGTLILQANGSFQYLPNVNYNGADQFTYQANDGELDSNPATVTLTVVPVDDPPAPVLITFDLLPDGSSPVAGTPIGDVYAGYGVTFGSLLPQDPTSPTFGDFSGSSATLLAQDYSRTPEQPFNVAARFTGPVSTVSADVYAASGYSVTMTALDADGGELASVTSAAGVSVFKGTLVLTDVGPIRTVVWQTSDPVIASPGVDNLAINRQLGLAFERATLQENGDRTTATVTRYGGDFGDPQVVRLVSTDPTELAVPAEITIPAGQAAVSFYVDAVDDALLDGTQAVTVTATADGYPLASAGLDVLDHETLTVAVDRPTVAESLDQRAVVVWITRSNVGDLDQSLRVDLATSDPSEAVIQPFVWLPAGYQTVGVYLAAVDDSLLDGLQEVTVSATAPGYVGADDVLAVMDYETLTVDIVADAISESGGAATATVFRDSTDIAQPLVVALVSSDPTEASVPPEVVIPANAPSISFTVTANDDAWLDGAQLVSIRASAAGYAAHSDTVTVLDHESLTVTIAVAEISESAGSTTASVTRHNTDIGQPLTVWLTSSDMSEATVSEFVVIPANVATVTFSVTVVDDLLVDGAQIVAITAQAPGYVAGSESLQVIQSPVDCGDAPDDALNPADYATWLASDGAAHVITGGIYLGTNVDADADGQPTAGADGDDTDAGGDDEDGVVFLTPLIRGSVAELTVNASASGLLDAWIDWNGDGDWADADEQVFTDRLLAAGANDLAIAVPESAKATKPTAPTFARFSPPRLRKRRRAS